MKNDPSKKILLVQLFANGDCLYATAVARQIKNDHPGCRLTWAIASSCKNIISTNPYVDEVLLTDEVAKNDVAAFRKYKRKIYAEKAAGLWDEVFMIMNMDTNLALYDGTIRGMILRAYPGKITVPVQPVLQLTTQELSNVEAFATTNGLSDFKHVILWEYAPQSGQSPLNFETALHVAEKLTADKSVCIILSSANKFESRSGIVDASVLSVRENAALTHYCNLLIGCSSGITWLTTSSAAKFLPMVQLLNPYSDFINAPSVDFKRYSIPHQGLIEMTAFDAERITDCVTTVMWKGFDAALIFNDQITVQFNTTKKIVYNLLVYREFAAIKKHYRIMVAVYGKNPLFFKAFYGAMVTAPFKLMKNIFLKAFKTKQA